MRMELISVDSSTPEKLVFDHLIQLYEYEFSNITKLEVDASGLFANVELQKGLNGGTCQPFLLRFEGKWAGLVVVSLKSYLNDDPQVKDIAEFFVMKLYRNRRLGYKMAKEVFDRFPGKWEIRQLPAAKEARTFWLKAIARYTNNHFQDNLIDHPRWKGYIQSFEK